MRLLDEKQKSLDQEDTGATGDAATKRTLKGAKR